MGSLYSAKPTWDGSELSLKSIIDKELWINTTNSVCFMVFWGPQWIDSRAQNSVYKSLRLAEDRLVASELICKKWWQGQSTSYIWRQQCSEAQLWSCANAGTCLSNHWEPIEVIRGIPCLKTICRPQPRAFLAAQTPGRDSMKKHVDVTGKIADFYRGKLRLN